MEKGAVDEYKGIETVGVCSCQDCVDRHNVDSNKLIAPESFLYPHLYTVSTD